MKMRSWLMSAVAFGSFAGAGLAQEAKEMPAQPAPAAPAVTAAPMILADGGCGNGCCISGCNTCCDDGCGRGGIIADISFMILKPYWQNNPAMFIQTDTGAVNPIDVKNFSDATQFVPRIALGYVGNSGLGVRLGWWGFATKQTDNIANPDGDLDIASASPLGFGVQDSNGGMVANYALRMNVWDLEVVQTFERGVSQFLLSGGIRYAHVSMDYNALDLWGVGPNTGRVHDGLLSGHNFNGAGPTVALQGTIGQTLYVTSTARGSVLFGKGEQSATELNGSFGAPQTITLQDFAYSSYDAVLPVAELEVGIGAKRAMRGSNAFVEVGFNAQAWIDAGNPARSTVGQRFQESTGNFIGGPSSDQTLGLFGAYLKAGLTY